MARFMRVTTNKTLLFINNYSNKLPVIDLKSKTCSAVCDKSFNIKFCWQHSRNFYSSKNDEQAEEHRTSPFDSILAKRRREAKRSVIIQVQSADSYADLYSYCINYGAINTMQHYVISKTSHFFLVEYQHFSSLQSLMESVTHINYNDIIPVHSQMLWFRSVLLKKSSKKSSTNENVPPLTQNKDTLTEKEINDAVTSKSTISEQMKNLYHVSKLEDLGTRLRFLTAQQMESSFTSLFPNITVLPFGSSINGFGRKSCDLDVVLSLESEKVEKESSRLIFHTKSALSEERAQTKRSMDTIATVIQYFMPGIKNVRRILHARVPIIKYDHSFTGLECDLSMTNMTAVYMSELLYLFGTSSDKVKPLVFTVRQWAAAVGITSADPGPFITNFSLTLMVLFYLQTQKILPSINYLKDHARPADQRITENCVDCTFLRDLKKWPQEERQKESLETILHDFFHFYANFDFSTKAISLCEGTSLCKTDSSALYIINPLERNLNVSKNVSQGEMARFVNAARNAASLMDEGASYCKRGLLDIFTEKQPPSKQYVLGKKSEKRLDVTKLFDGESRNERKLKEEIRLRPVNLGRMGKR